MESDHWNIPAVFLSMQLKMFQQIRCWNSWNCCVFPLHLKDEFWRCSFFLEQWSSGDVFAVYWMFWDGVELEVYLVPEFFWGGTGCFCSRFFFWFVSWVMGEELTGGEDLPWMRGDGTRTGEDLAWRREMEPELGERKGKRKNWGRDLEQGRKGDGISRGKGKTCGRRRWGGARGRYVCGEPWPFGGNRGGGGRARTREASSFPKTERSIAVVRCRDDLLFRLIKVDLGLAASFFPVHLLFLFPTDQTVLVTPPRPAGSRDGEDTIEKQHLTWGCRWGTGSGDSSRAGWPWVAAVAGFCSSSSWYPYRFAIRKSSYRSPAWRLASPLWMDLHIR